MRTKRDLQGLNGPAVEINFITNIEALTQSIPKSPQPFLRGRALLYIASGESFTQC